MSEDSAPDTEGDLSSRQEGSTAERLAEVLRLTTLLTDQVLDAQIMKHPIPHDKVRALEDAALLLKEHAVPLPPLLMQALHEVEAAEQTDLAEADPNQSAQGVDYTRAVKLIAKLLFKPSHRS